MSLKSMKLATPVSEGWLFSKDNETDKNICRIRRRVRWFYSLFGAIGFSNFLCEEDNSDSLTINVTSTSTVIMFNKTCCSLLHICAHLHSLVVLLSYLLVCHVFIIFLSMYNPPAFPRFVSAFTAAEKEFLFKALIFDSS